jgi:hypothetical protein
MRSLLLLLLLGHAACRGCDTPPEPTVVEAAPTPPPYSDLVLYAFEVQLVTGEVHGTRVFDDGRVEAHVGPAADPWSASHTLPVAALTALREALASPELAGVPERLPEGPNPPPDAPRATWTLHPPGGLRTITAERFAGVRVPPLERIEQVLGRSHTNPRVITTWTVTQAEGPPIVVEVPCQPLTTRRLRLLTARLLAKDLAPSDDLTVGAPLLIIDWQEAQRRWRTTLTEDHRVVHLATDGRFHAAQLSEEQTSVILAELSAVDWTNLHEACDRED